MRYPAMKTAILTLLAFLPLCLCAQEYDFAKKIGGNTLYFYITSTGGKDGVTPDRSRGRNANPDDDDTTIYTVTAIRYFAFAGCDRITRLTLPATIKEIGEGAFAGCKRIEYIVSQNPEPPKLDESSFDQVDLDIPVRVPMATYESYHQAVGWRQFTEITEY